MMKRLNDRVWVVIQMTQYRLALLITFVFLTPSYPGCGSQRSSSPSINQSEEAIVPNATKTQSETVSDAATSMDGMDVVIHNGHNKGLTAVGLSPNGQYVLSGSSDGTAKLWDVASGEVIRTYAGPYGYGLGPWEVGFSDDGTKVLLEDRFGTRAFDVNSGRLQEGRWELRLKKEYLQYGDVSTVSPNGEFRVIEPKSKRNIWIRGPLIIWNAAGETIRTLETHNSPNTGNTNTLTFSRDGRYLAWADTDLMGSGMAKVWEVASWRLVGDYPASVVNFSRDSRGLVLGHPTGGAPYLRDLMIGEETLIEKSPKPSGVSAVAIADNGRSVVAGMYNGSVILWDLTKGQPVRTFECPNNQAVLSVAVSSTGPLMASACADGSAWLWEMTTGKPIRRLAPSLKETLFRSAVRFSSNGMLLAIGAGDQLSLQNVVDGKEVRRIRIPRQTLPAWTKDLSSDLTDKLYRIRSIAVHANGQLLAMSNGLGINLWNIETGQLVRNITDTPACSLSFTPDGRTLLARYEYESYQWDVATGRAMSPVTVPVPQEHLEALEAIHKIVFDRISCAFAISADGRLTAHSDGSNIKVSDLADNKSPHELKGRQGEITGLAFAPNGRILVSGSSDGAVRLWDQQNGKEIAALISLGQSEFVTITPDHYYRASKTPVKGVSFQVGEKLLPLEQFAEKFNRPDIVQQRLNAALAGSSERPLK